MEANNNSKRKKRRCPSCHRHFTPHPSIGERQLYCSRSECQRYRHKQNQKNWLDNNEVDYKLWYKKYGKPWRKRHPDYQRTYRKKRKALLTNRLQETGSLVPAIPGIEKKDELTLVKTKNHLDTFREKKDQSTYQFYLLKVKGLQLWQWHSEKKDEPSPCVT